MLRFNDTICLRREQKIFQAFKMGAEKFNLRILGLLKTQTQNTLLKSPISQPCSCKLQMIAHYSPALSE